MGETIDLISEMFFAAAKFNAFGTQLLKIVSRVESAEHGSYIDCFQMCLQLFVQVNDQISTVLKKRTREKERETRDSDIWRAKMILTSSVYRVSEADEGSIRVKGVRSRVVISLIVSSNC